MKTLCRLSAIGAILLLFGADAGPVFGQGGGPGPGGSHGHSGGGHGAGGFRGGLGLVGPPSSMDFVGAVGGFGGGFGGGWGAWFPGYPNDPYGYESGRIPTPPYFAIHPPVYYGRRVGMPYGNSTVTRPPREVVDVHPLVQQVVQVRQPMMIVNPFVVEVAEAAENASSPEPSEVARDQTAARNKVVVDKQRRRKTERDQKAKASSGSKRKAR